VICGGSVFAHFETSFAFFGAWWTSQDETDLYPEPELGPRKPVTPSTAAVVEAIYGAIKMGRTPKT
jgi:hypothetical protein